MSTVDQDENGQNCIRIVWVEDPGVRSTASEIEQAFISQMGRFPACPDQEPAPAGPSITAAVAAITYWLSAPLPEATPTVPPGTMIVALPAHLVTDARLTDTLETSSPFGPVRIEATSHLTVDWGDGTTTGPHHTPGAPYPSGDITHRYANSGTYTLTLTQHWAGTWTVGARTGTLPTRTVTTTLDDLLVEQLQAVRTR